jgi:hypothetical protein
MTTATDRPTCFRYGQRHEPDVQLTGLLQGHNHIDGVREKLVQAQGRRRKQRG